MIDDLKAVSRRTRRAKSLRATREKTAYQQHKPVIIRPFRTPEEVAAADDLTEEPTLPEPPPSQAAEAKKRSGRFPHISLTWPPTKKQWLIGAAALVIIAGGSVGAWALMRHPAKVVQAPVAVAPKVTKAAPLLVASTLSGLPVSPGVNSRPVTGIMVENSTFARPQAGLSQAGVVFEALAEGGITRFLALYQDQLPNNVGPIRSVRPYYLQWDLGFDAPIAHVGGSPQALSDITFWHVEDLDEFYNGGSYHRISSREAPHNVYTNLADLNRLEASKGFTSSSFSGFPRKADSPAKQPTAKSISMILSSSTYDVSYAYKAATNSYNRSEGGAPQVDSNTGAQLSPKVVIAIVVPYAEGALDSSGAYYSDYSVTGFGRAYVFQDGTETTGTWAKSSNTSQITFTNDTGTAIDLNAGQTWITAITSAGDVSYSAE
jgi:hypothetical protein